MLVAGSSATKDAIRVRSIDGREFGPARRIPHTSAAYGDTEALGNDGTLAVAWEEERPAPADADELRCYCLIRARTRRPTGSFRSPQVVVPATDDVEDYGTAVDPRGDAVVVWSTTDALKLTLAPRGRAFGRPQTILTPGADWLLLGYAHGRLRIAVQRYDGFRFSLEMLTVHPASGRVTRRVLGDERTLPEFELLGATGASGLAADGRGGLLALWTRTSKRGTYVYAATRRRTGRLGPPRRLWRAGSRDVTCDPSPALAGGGHALAGIDCRDDQSEYFAGYVQVATGSLTRGFSRPTRRLFSHPAGTLAVDVDRRGRALAAWKVSAVRERYVALTGSGGSLHAPHLLSTTRDETPASPAVSIAADGTGTIAWTEDARAYAAQEAIR
ncbi:MAG: hypothetical protein M3P50_02210 [Actinomycetota bacterium]|nr:hypothetical protein [Actinomycetota bacterium]